VWDIGNRSNPHFPTSIITNLPSINSYSLGRLVINYDGVRHLPRAHGVVGGATDVGRCTARRPGIDMPAMPVGPLGDAMIQ
jgi:hypothetical protein